MPVSTAACWWLAGCLFVCFLDHSRWKPRETMVSQTRRSVCGHYRSTPPKHQQVSPARKENKKKKEIKGKTKAPLEFLDWQNCDRSKAVCVCRGQALRETLQMETICWRWSRLSSTFFCLSAAVRSPPLVFSGLLGAFVDSFLVLS